MWVPVVRLTTIREQNFDETHYRRNAYKPTQSHPGISRGWGKTWVYPRAGPRSHLGSRC